ncbi:hypothetical protein ABS71_05795 [bacterium SCN 62-11]|nr:hypothetical protein [Candidatus Eremiobacteraeota bacterium]ODT74297.1 MAG: hypothetical protein ABS71_05795 [bacterium SCN 62-11]
MSKTLKQMTLALGTVCLMGVSALAAGEKTVEGTVTKWSDSTSSFQTKATIETWTFSFDKSKLQKVGTPKVGAHLKISYHMNGKEYVADKVEVLKK